METGKREPVRESRCFTLTKPKARSVIPEIYMVEGENGLLKVHECCGTGTHTPLYACTNTQHTDM